MVVSALRGLAVGSAPSPIGCQRRRRATWTVTLAAAVVVLVTQVDIRAICFSAACSSLRRPASSGVAMRAAGFASEASKSKKDAKKGTATSEDASESDGEPSGKIVKDKRTGESAAITNTKLNDLREKTLARRVQREADIDEYEKGRAMIAKYGPKAGVMPEKVAKRTAKRGFVIGGAFYGIMIAAFAGGIFLYRTQDLIIAPTMMAFLTLFFLAATVLGSGYGLMSASWDKDNEGSLLGWDEFGDNVKVLGDGFRKATLQPEFEKAIDQRNDRRKLLAAKEEKKRELLAE
mmetsp:Transcript_3069/g.8730  ORF Transcript_3069/g.8730 Transcript_3069/m.8730 type:complete len:291 (+) Transcript_3069:77-949(+)